MEKKMTFNYFYGTEADQFSFYRIPKALFTDSYFKDLSSDAKILYGLMLDRMSLSIKNQWFDDKNRAYIYFSIEDIMELLNCGRNKAIKSMRELDDETGIGLIEKRRQGFGKVNVIYVKTFMLEKTDEKKFGEELEKFKKQTSVENEESTEVYNSNFMKSQNQTSRSPENKLQEVYISNPNNTNLSDTEMNDNKSNPIISVDEKRFDSDNRSEDYQAYENLVKETIDYESLEVTHHDDMRQVDEIVNLIVETVMCKNDKILIASNWYPASLVKKKFLMLTYPHIEYVLHCMTRISQQECRGILELKEDMKMSENNDYIQLPPLKKDTPADVVAFMWEYMKVPEDSREKVKNLLKDANENGVKISHQAPTLYDVVPKEEIAEFEELMRKTIADIVSEASSVACWVYVQKYVKHKTLNEMLQELPDVGQFILAMDTWFEKLMEK